MINLNYNKFIKYLFNNFKKKTFFIFLLSILETLLEIFSIIILISALTLLLTKNYTYNLFNFFHYNFDSSVGLFYLIVIIYFIKNLSLILIHWMKLDLCGKIYKKLSQSTYKTLLYKNNLYLNNFSQGDMAQSVIEETGFTKEVITSFVSILTEILIIFSLFLFIGYQNINAAIITIISLLIGGYAYYLFMKNKNIILGEKRQFFSIKIMNLLFQSLSLHKLILLGDKIKYFLERFTRKITILYKISRDQITIQYSARLWLEICLLIILVFTITPLIKDDSVNSDKVSNILLIAIVSIRFVPSFANVLGSFSTIQYGKKAVSNIMNILENNNNDDNIIKNINLNFDKLIIKSLSFKYEGNENYLFHNFNAIFKNNSLIGIKGENGSGKTTLLKIISGLIHPNEGHLTINSKSIYDEKKLHYNWKKNIGYADQKIIFSNETVLNIIAFGVSSENINEKLVESCLEKVDLLNFFKDKSDKLNMLLGENGIKLSAGQLQKLNIARALYSKPKILILDEITNNLDTKSQEKILDLLISIKRETLIIIASHSSLILDQCDEIINL